MRCVSTAVRALTGLCLITLVGLSAGCYSRGYGNPYGYNQYPAYGAPIQTLTPGGQYVPGGSYPADGTYLGNPQPLGAPGPYNASPSLQPQPDPQFSQPSTGAAPPSTFTPGPTGSDVNVPNPSDPYFPSPSGSADDGGFMQPNKSTDPIDGRSFKPAASLDLEEQGAMHNQSHQQEPDTASTDAATFVSPVEYIPVSTTSVDAAQGPNPYAYDRTNYSWVRGVLEFDEAAGAWVVIYSTGTDPHDTYSGKLWLADDAQLANFESGDIVLLEGRVRAGEDGHGVYIAEQITLLEADI